LGSEEEFGLLRGVAELLRASVGGTRVAVDHGWIPFERQVGQTGTVVSPRFLMTLATSGAIQYTNGFRDSGYVVAVDKNPRAAIFEVADLGVVADVHELLPELLGVLEARAGSPRPRVSA
jgi:electron transfer flavoprotein alpha subunit